MKPPAKRWTAGILKTFSSIGGNVERAAEVPKLLLLDDDATLPAEIISRPMNCSSFRSRARCRSPSGCHREEQQGRLLTGDPIIYDI